MTPQLKAIKQLKGILSTLGYDSDEIESKISEKEELKDWKPITLGELEQMDEKEYSSLLSYCWRDDKPRCSTVGIRNVEIREQVDTFDGGIFYGISFSDDDGDPNFILYDKKDKIHKVGHSEWTYGLYKKRKK